MNGLSLHISSTTTRRQRTFTISSDSVFDPSYSVHRPSAVVSKQDPRSPLLERALRKSSRYHLVRKNSRHRPQNSTSLFVFGLICSSSVWKLIRIKYTKPRQGLIPWSFEEVWDVSLLFFFSLKVWRSEEQREKSALPKEKTYKAICCLRSHRQKISMCPFCKIGMSYVKNMFVFSFVICFLFGIVFRQRSANVP